MDTSWPARPVIYEINTWVWLNELSRQNKRAITLNASKLIMRHAPVTG
jgi:hypothetical protein